MPDDSFETNCDAFGLSEKSVVLEFSELSVLFVVLSFVCVSIIWEGCSSITNCRGSDEQAVSSSAASGTRFLPIFTLIIQSAKPFLDFRSRVGNVPLVYCKRVLNNVRVRLQLLDGIYRSRKAAAVVNVEGNYRLSRKIVLVEKAVHYLRKVRPPIRIADKYRVVFVEIVYVARKLGAGVIALLLGGVIYKLPPSAG